MSADEVNGEEGEELRRNDPSPANFEALDLINGLNQKPLEDLLEDAHKALIVDLLAKLKSGQASHQELAILRNLLRDNGLVIAPKDDETERRDRERPPADLPSFDPPEYDL